MKKLFFLLSILIAAQSFAKDTTKVKMKEWLGVLTLAEKYVIAENRNAEAQKNRDGALSTACENEK